MRTISVVAFFGLFSPLLGYQRPGSAVGSDFSSTRRAFRVQLDAAIGLSVNYLERVCKPGGIFFYEIDMESGRQSNTYNIVRHAGVVYALAMFNRSHPDFKAADTIARAATFLRTKYVGPDIRTRSLVVWSRPLPASSETVLGASGLGLVALVEGQRVQSRAFRLEDLQNLARFILAMQKSDGSFFSKYGAERGPYDDPRDPQTLYYPGEAVLGLISLYELDHSPEWLVAAGRALSYLARSRAKMRVPPPDHWALIATARFLPYFRLAPPSASRTELIEHASRISERILHEQIESADPVLDGAFDTAGWTTPAAIRLEGLLAALEFLPHENTELRRRIESATQRGVVFLLHAQITSGPYAGGMPGVVRPTGFITTKANPAASEVRIDYVQHALSAWLRYQALIENHQLIQ
jgi:hypothetical protein